MSTASSMPNTWNAGIHRSWKKKLRCDMSDFTQEQLMNYVALAIKALTPTLGYRMMIRDIQKYLREQWGIEETMWRIKEAETEIYELEEAENLAHLFIVWLRPEIAQVLRLF